MKKFSSEDAKRIGDAIGVDWSRIPLSQFQLGLDVEMEHGRGDPQTNVTNNDSVTTGKIALAHLKEDPYYYTKLKKVEGDKKESAAQSTALLLAEGARLLR
jgi:hypothetical protein